jgi:uncharacterized protein (TIGR02145 family)
MKKIILTIFVLVTIYHFGFTQSDTIYIMKSGIVIGKYNVNTQLDSIIFYQPALPDENTFLDLRDGNVYHTVTIGNQIWMAENLRYLPNVIFPSIASATIPYCYVYGYDGIDISEAIASPNYITYGTLYNWPAAMAGSSSSSANPSGIQGICPTGWHLPSESEWNQLSTFLGGNEIAGGKLKEIGISHWSVPNEGATNESGFTALPGGSLIFESSLYSDYAFGGIGTIGLWWSSTEWMPQYPNYRSLLNSVSGFGSDSESAELAFSVRCVKN